jgi:TRAP-type C4-dicarboxylate transport system permease small subunit
LRSSINDTVRQDATVASPFSLQVVNADHETLMIFVRYSPNENRQAMNIAIDAARQVIMIAAKSYGWDKWVKVTERVEMTK